MPNLLKHSESILNEKDLIWKDSYTPLLGKKIEKFKALKNRIQKEDVQKLKDELLNKNEKNKQKEEKNEYRN